MDAENPSATFLVKIFRFQTVKFHQSLVMCQRKTSPSTGSDISFSGGVNVQLVHRYRVQTNSYLEGFPPSNNNDESINKLIAV